MDHGSGDCNNQSQPYEPFLDRMEICKVTKKPTDSATFACLFSTFLDTTSTETRGAKNGSWIWRLQQPIAAK